MQDEPQNTNIKDDVSPAIPHGEKVIQPSASLIEEMRVSQATPPTPAQTPATESPLQATQSSNDTPQPPTVQTPRGAIYPEVTRGIGTETPTTAPQNDPIPGPKLVQGPTPKTIAVKVVAGVLFLMNLSSVYYWFVGPHGGVYNYINIIVIVIGLLLAIGIFTLSEMARSIYVIISAIGLAFACIGFVLFYLANFNNAAFQAQVHAQPPTKAQLEQRLSEAENNTSWPAQTKQAEIKQLQSEIRNASSSPTVARVRGYVTTALFFVTSVGPLIFFTRPSIISVFS